MVWACDPMHGNTFVSEGGRKTRRFDDILAELKGFFAAHHQVRHVARRRAPRAHRGRRHRMPRRVRRHRRGTAARALHHDLRSPSQRPTGHRPRLPRRGAPPGLISSPDRTALSAVPAPAHTRRCRWAPVPGASLLRVVLSVRMGVTPASGTVSDPPEPADTRPAQQGSQHPLHARLVHNLARARTRARRVSSSPLAVVCRVRRADRARRAAPADRRRPGSATRASRRTGRWPRTAGSSPSAAFPSTGPWAAVKLAAPMVGIAPTTTLSGASGRGYWTVASDGGVFTFGNAAVPRVDGGRQAQQAHGGHGRRPRHRRVLDRGVGRRGVRLRRAVLRVDGRGQAHQARGRHRGHPRRRRLLALRLGRRGLRLRRRRVRRVAGQAQAPGADRGGDLSRRAVAT